MPQEARGFSLIELMIVVAIIAILAAIAFPAYRGYTSRGKIVNAVAGLSGEKIKVAENYNAGKVGVRLCDGVATNGVSCDQGTLLAGSAGVWAADTSVRLQPIFPVGGEERISWVCTVLTSPTKRYTNSDCFSLMP